MEDVLAAFPTHNEQRKNPKAFISHFSRELYGSISNQNTKILRFRNIQGHEEGPDRMQRVHASDLPARAQLERAVELPRVRRRHPGAGPVGRAQVEARLQPVRRHHPPLRERAQGQRRGGRGLRLRGSVGHRRIQTGTSIIIKHVCFSNCLIPIPNSCYWCTSF